MEKSSGGIEKVNILGSDVDCVDFAATLDIIAGWIEGATQQPPTTSHQPLTTNHQPPTTNHQPLTTNHQPPTTSHHIHPLTTRQICTVNPEFIVDARRDRNFAAVLANADLRVPDGVGVLWAARLSGIQLEERVTGSDGIYRICKRAAERGWRVFLLGAAPEVAAEAAVRLQKHYPSLQVVGTHCGSPEDKAWSAIQMRLEETQPDILFVAFGHPRQDLWIAQHRHELCATVAIGVGGAFDFVAGVLPRAPLWMQRVGMEWLYRLLLQPSRIGRMMKIPLFMGLVLQWYFRRR